ncbi:class I tRNA ligase family protein, partial [Akkermansia muciniphila]
PHTGESIMVASFPEYDEALSFTKEEAEFEKIMVAIKAIRNQRSQMNIPPSKKAGVYIETAETAVFEMGKPFFQRLASASTVEVAERFGLEVAVRVITDAARMLIPTDELVDKEKERARLTKERE